ncbi:N-acetylglucosamine-6-phosphate deacetylase [Dictyobacter sp. S3.2.2.5]|uniref:N-acetylglucosamine-6-phosphate deacetylase n=1 Tax=Dictyobacter halimunensis TaxID=3026934 RepID=A0ABQ6FNQ7_9CHLR|nr:N-acetylglucosamine-6-phosphate deacetylase [Dictyobacter sp. S3.2.2.5]
MKTLVIKNARIVTPQQVIEEAAIVVRGERIAEIRSDNTYPADAAVVDASGCTIVPGFIDVHVHGAAGYDTMDATPEALHGMAEFFAAHGVTSFLPTTVTAEHTALLAAIANVAQCQQSYQRGARILGVHLEGPYLSEVHPGAQPVQHIRPADRAEYTQLFAQDNIRLISLAPEKAENLALIEYARSQGAVVAVGHSAASYDDVMQAVKAGLTQACHTFNGMAGLHHRTPGTVGAVLSCDDIYAQVIVDLIHLHPAVVKLLVRAKGTARTVLITDAIRAAGLPDGIYDLGGQSVSVRQGVVSLTHGNSLAGSTLTMDQALRNVMKATGLPLVEALPMATSVPARSLGLDADLGSILPDYLADLVLLDQNLQVQATIVLGNVVYQATEVLSQ